MFWLERSGHRRDHLLLVLACFALVSFPEKGSECCHCNNSQRACREHPPLTVQPRTVICHLKAHYPWLTLSSCLHMLNQATLTKSLLSLLGSSRGGCFSPGQPPSTLRGPCSRVQGAQRVPPHRWDEGEAQETTRQHAATCCEHQWQCCDGRSAPFWSSHQWQWPQSP